MPGGNEARDLAAGSSLRAEQADAASWPGEARPRVLDKDKFSISKTALKAGLFENYDKARYESGYLLAGAPSSLALAVSWRVKTAPLPTVVMVASSDPKGDLHIERTFSREANGQWTVDHTYFFIANAYRGGGAKRMLRASVEAYERIGVSHIVVHANLDLGGYVWAKLGFVANSPQNVRDMLNKAAADNPDIAVFAEAQRVAKKTKDDELMYRLANLNMSGEISAGKLLLAGSDWYGHIKLNNINHRNRLAECFSPDQVHDTSRERGGSKLERT